MTPPNSSESKQSTLPSGIDEKKTQNSSNLISVALRIVVGGIFIYMGLNKVLHPVEFLKLVRQYDAIHNSFFLNFIASTLPWFEIFCGVLLVGGIAVRGTAVMLVAMLIPFTVLVYLRALKVGETGAIPFCAIKFDCGCGGGEVLICRKIGENILLVILSARLIFSRRDAFCLRRDLL
jgi:uncharacterized membrane protein YphA (DoxX/SURF4 family)